jgi:hypothetical protein
MGKPQKPDNDYSDAVETYTGDPEDTRKALVQDEDYKNFLTDLYSVARSGSGARVLCEIFDRLGTFNPSWSDKNARLAKAAVLKDFGQDLMDDLAVADDEVHDLIQRMMRIRRKSAGSLNTLIKQR